MNATKRWWQSVSCAGASRSEWPVAERWNCSRHCDCAGYSRSKTSSDGCISRRRDQVPPVGWSVAVQARVDQNAQFVLDALLHMAANDDRAAERMHDYVAMSRPPNVQLCWALTVVAGCRRLEDQRRQRCSSATGCEPEHWQDRTRWIPPPDRMPWWKPKCFSSEKSIQKNDLPCGKRQIDCHGSRPNHFTARPHGEKAISL